MNYKKIILLALSIMTMMTAKAQETKVITMLEGEKWWGSVTDLGNIMPFDSETTVRFNHQTQNFNNQTTPLLVSNKGRYIWSDSPFKAEIKDGNISLEAARGTATDAARCIHTITQQYIRQKAESKHILTQPL